MDYIQYKQFEDYRHYKQFEHYVNYIRYREYAYLGKHTHRHYEADMQNREVGRVWPAGARPPSPQGLPRQPRRRAQHGDDPHRSHKDCHDTCEDEHEPHRDHGDDCDGHDDGHEEMTGTISKDKPIVKKEITTQKVTSECEATKKETKEEKAEGSLGTRETLQRLFEDSAPKLKALHAEAEKLADIFRKNKKDNG